MINLATMVKMAGAKPKRRKRPTRVKYPFAIESEYAKHLRKIMGDYTQELIEVMSQAIEPEIAEWKARFKDAVVEKKTIIHGKLDVLPKDVDVIEEDLLRIANNNKFQINKQINSVLGINPLVYEPYLEPILQGFVFENVALIKSLKGEILEKSEKIIRNGVTSGLARGEISKQLKALGGMSDYRADLIARDQSGKFYGQLTKQRHQSIGVEKFMWTTAGDDDVRKFHSNGFSPSELEGQIFTWKDGANGLFPGQDINCRCVAQAVLDDIMEEL